MSDAGPLPALRIFKTVHCYRCCPCPGSASCRTKDSLSYKEAGVNIAAGSELVGKIKPLAKATEREGCVSSLGSFAALFDLKRVGYQDPMLVSATDGVGTKLKVCLFFVAVCPSSSPCCLQGQGWRKPSSARLHTLTETVSSSSFHRQGSSIFTSVIALSTNILL